MKGDEITFSVSLTRAGVERVTKYTGKISGDTIKGKVVTETDGKAGRERDWEAKIEKPQAAK